jgi:hypothetical protein
MYNIIRNIIFTGMVLATLPLKSYGIECWCQQGPSSYQTLVDNGEYWSSYTNCYLTGNNPSSDTCYDATCPGGDWVLGNYYAYGEILVYATDGDDCISQCSALGNGYNIANMDATCDSSAYYNDNYNDNYNDANSFGSCNILTCPQVWDGHCGSFNKPTDKWCDYDGTDANVCCAEDYSECCESDGGAIGGITVAGLAIIIFCLRYFCKCRFCWESESNKIIVSDDDVTVISNENIEKQ